MEPVVRPSFDDLPSEVILLILRYAAQPSFTHSDEYEMKNHYSTALKFCLVSRAVRCAVLTEMLHTLLLGFHNMTAFAHALRTQKEYNKQKYRLFFAYTPHIRRVWIGEFCGYLTDSTPVRSSFASSVTESDLSLLAPVLLGAPSLAVDFSSLNVDNIIIDHKRSSPPICIPGFYFQSYHPPSHTDWNILYVNGRSSGAIGCQDYNLPQ
ncbi:hypothetical protein BDR05DRAFT_1056063 [Suillus weaverae]|nr:hypothetical protein BDR05DRAFT_1056063 [Suillus weaverae]